MFEPRVPRRILYCAMALALSLALVLCGTIATQPNKTDITIGYASPSGVMTPLFVAQEQGLFEKYASAWNRTGGGTDAGGRHRPNCGLGGALVKGAMRGAPRILRSFFFRKH